MSELSKSKADKVCFPVRSILIVVMITIVTLPAVMIFAMHAHLDAISFSNMSSIYHEIKVDLASNVVKTPPAKKLIVPTVDEANDKGALRAKSQTEELERLEHEVETKLETQQQRHQPTRTAKGRNQKLRDQRQQEEDEQEFSFRELEKEWIQIMPTPKKTQLKQDRRVVIREANIKPLQRAPGPPSNELGRPKSYIAAQEVLRKHPLFGILREESTVPESQDVAALHASVGMEDEVCGPRSICRTMLSLSQQPECQHLPIFLTMASVGDELYWQLIENFVYTLVKFELVQCALVICVSDAYCMKLCRESLFPCFDYRRPVPTPYQQKKYHLSLKPSVMESIAELKLYHIPQALLQGVHTFMLDLDVGFLNDPRHMIQPFFEVPTIDIFVQQDYLFIMNRSKAGWKQWFTEPLPNIGMFLVRGNNKTHAVFSHAWRKYQDMIDPKVREQPGKDQNHVLDGMRVGRGTFGLRYAYFSNSTAALMDKIVQKWRGVELGGQPAADMFTRENTLAMHTTCYEQSTKVMGLKATNAFWNPRYYDPLRPTLTKQILFESTSQVRDEIRSLVWLAMATGRAIVSPNLLGPPELFATSPQHRGQAMWPGFRVTYLKRVRKPSNSASLADEIDMTGTMVSIKQNALKVQILEPAFYWRLQRDYDDAPAPKVLFFDEGTSLLKVRDAIAAESQSSRLVLHFRKASSSESRTPEQNSEDLRRVSQWAEDSVGEMQDGYEQEIKRYVPIPSVKSVRKEPSVDDVLQGMRTCNDVFERLRGNRTCFQICD